jgi:cyclophilin family peptidyl-prolyl cis-trans isomerase
MNVRKNMGKRAREKKAHKISQKKEFAIELKNRKQVVNWKKIIFNPAVIVAIFSLLAIIAYPIYYSYKQNQPLYAVLKTSEGDIKIELYKTDAPKTVDNFVKLSDKGFYRDLLWHRVIKDFVIQTGDPTGSGSGGPGYQFDDEISSHKIVKGTVAMANSGKNTNGSQFFIVTEQDQPDLDGSYSVFGQVIEGMDTVARIAEKPTDENDKPYDPVYLNQVDILQ